MKNNLKTFLYVPKSVMLLRKPFANASLQDTKKFTNKQWMATLG